MYFCQSQGLDFTLHRRPAVESIRPSSLSPFHDAPTTGPRGRAGPTKTPQRPSRCRYTPHDPPSAARKRAHRRAPSIRPVLPARPSPTAGTAWGASARPWGCRAARPDTCAGLPVVLQAPMVLGASRGLHGRPARRRARPRQRDLDPTVTSGAHGGSRRVPRSRAGAPRGHLAHARQRQPRGHRARRLRPEGEAARTTIRRAGAFFYKNRTQIKLIFILGHFAFINVPVQE